uniref:Uncharacterized protein n=1 Tax=Opuntia streptacantha TaxID=393608 RepID=A0A7C8ZPV6_OPUST
MGDLSNWVATSIQRQLESLPLISSDCCIYRVPENLRKVNEDAYRPLLVSIGPFYHHDSTLAPMKQQKLRYLQSFLLRNSAHNLGRYVEAIKEWEQITRQCYVTTVSLSSVIFIEMVLVDALFIIELFLRSWFHDLIDENDRIFNKPRVIVEVNRDLRIQENQLPFSILKGLYDLVLASSSGRPPFVDLAYNFFMGKKEAIPKIIANADVKHFVDLLRLCHLPSTLRPQRPSSHSLKFELCPSVTRLNEAGVKFVASQSTDLLNIRFSNGVLEIPRLVLTDQTESLFRNVMVFEQCHHFSDSYIIDYFAFFDGLINTPEDVEMLVQNGVIENWLGNNEEAAALFANIFKQTRLRGDNFYYSNLCRDLNAYANTAWHRWKATLKHEYFNHPWAIISVIYAFVLLVLTVLQTVSGFTSNK